MRRILVAANNDVLLLSWSLLVMYVIFAISRIEHQDAVSAAAFSVGSGKRSSILPRRRNYSFSTSSPFSSSTSSFLCSTTTKVQQPQQGAGSSSEKSKSSASLSSKQQQQRWYPTRIQDTLSNYDAIVCRLYLRHIVMETQAMAQEALRLATSTTTRTTTTPEETSSSVDDPFGEIARSVSTCLATRDDGGTIGWVERNNNINTVPDTVLSPALIDELYRLQPKAGDVHILYDDSYQRWHVLQVSEIWTNPDALLSSTTTNGDDDNAVEQPVGSFSGQNLALPRRKPLKGSGVIPEFPELQSYSIQTAGCQMNVADSERLAGILQHDLHLHASDPLDAQLVIFNTCSIRDHAEQKLYDALGPYARVKRRGDKRLAIIVTGCVAQQEGQKLLHRVPEIDAVVGPQYIPYLKTVLKQISLGQQVVVTAPMLLQEDDFLNKPVRGHSVRAWVNVIHGCNEHCTYCVVPGTRGMEQSRTMDAILQECLELAKVGYREVTLLGQNIDAYGRDMVPKRSFAGLLHFLNDNLPGQMRIRYVTSHPRYFSDRVIDAVANLDKVCECFHMPFQAGDDQVLQDMRRGYTYDSYMKIIDKIRAQAPDAAICADIIVGFPGESEKAFQKTLQLMEEVKFDNVNSFAYSPRPNTEAALWSNQIDDTTKADRLQRVQELANRHGLERSQRYLGRIVDVLVEDANPRNPQSQVMGRTRQGRQVYFDGDLSQLHGEFVKVKITEARTWSLMGELVEE